MTARDDENRLEIALQAREAMRKYRKGKPIAFQPPQIDFKATVEDHFAEEVKRLASR